MTIRVVYLGTPEFAVPPLQAMLQDPEIEVLGVVTQPDRPAGRGKKLVPPEVKVLALEVGLPVYQPEKIRTNPDTLAWLRQLAPDFLVTAAFGQILSQEVLDIPRYCSVNIHASLLPKYRGPNPVQWAIINGDTITGVTIMEVSLGVDEGPMMHKIETPIDPDENADELTQRLAQLGAQILPEALRHVTSGTLKSQPQKPNEATYAPKLSRVDANIDWTQPAQCIHDKVRGQQPWPGAVSYIQGIPLKIVKTRSPKLWQESKDFVKDGKAGAILAIIKSGLVVQTGTGAILVETVQPPGKPKMPARDWANGVQQHMPLIEFEKTEKLEIT
jgi:methionyl-tRNA formyltransferase